jgi:hypothetical protein
MAAHFYEAIVKLVVVHDDASSAANHVALWLTNHLPGGARGDRTSNIRAGRVVGVREIDDEIVGDIKK